METQYFHLRLCLTGKSWTKIGKYKCTDKDGRYKWKGIKPNLNKCKRTCEGYKFMTFVERGDKNCACQNLCNNQVACGDVSQSACDTYEMGKCISD